MAMEMMTSKYICAWTYLCGMAQSIARPLVQNSVPMMMVICPITYLRFQMKLVRIVKFVSNAFEERLNNKVGNQSTGESR